MTKKSPSKMLKIPRSTGKVRDDGRSLGVKWHFYFLDPVLYDDKITIINISLNEGEDDVVYNDVMNVEEFLKENNIRYHI